MSRTDATAVPDYGSLLRLDGKTVVILGAGQGIGRQTAHAIAAVGGHAVCVDRDPDLASDVAEEVDGFAWHGDVTNRESFAEMVSQTVRRHGRINGLVDIIGGAEFGLLTELDDDQWDRTFNLNLRHAFLALQLVGREMKAAGGGTMAFVASASGMRSAYLHAPYGSAKAALVNLIHTAAVEFGPSGIRVNGVAPGATDTPRIATALANGETKGFDSLSPTGRRNTPADIAQTLLYLTTPLSGNVNGQVISIDGGVGLRDPYHELLDRNRHPSRAVAASAASTGRGGDDA